MLEWQPVLAWLAKAFAWTVFFTAPTHASMLAIIVLVAVDLLVGVWASAKEGKKITSFGLRRTVTQKIFPYQTAVLCAHLLEVQFLPMLPLMKALAGFIAVTESKSIFENLGRITGLDFWTVIRERLQSQKNHTKSENSPAQDTNLAQDKDER